MSWAFPSATSDEYIVGGKWPKNGHPSVGKIPPAALDCAAAERLWEISEELTGVRYQPLPQKEHGPMNTRSDRNRYGPWALITGLIFKLISSSLIDNWGHVFLGLVLLMIGFATPKQTAAV